MTIYADIYGDLRASANGRAYGKPFIGREGQFMGNTGSSLDAGAAVTAFLRADVGWSDVLAFGVTAQFDIIRINAAHQASEFLLTRPNWARVQWSTATPVGISTMNGRAYAYADTLFGDFEEDLVSWGGVSWNSDIWNHSGVAEFPQ